ncbi:MAG: Holliday junction branch migration protein RuvA [Lachnospiraceae bacterium]|nr:Holliday junction branch migration protein RuvA [Lachnospiraceae bacterium]
MISHLRGELTYVRENKVEIDTGALGFEVQVPMTVIDRLPGIGSPIELFTYMNVKEDEMSLFGFPDRDSLDMFKLLITVSGIGPKGALGILSSMTPSDIRFAVLSQDVKAISKAPGIGSKTAQRLIIELKDKVSLSDGLEHMNDDVRPVGNASDSSEKSEAIIALTVLGYSNTDAFRAVSGIDTAEKTTEEILKEALKRIGR